jgi:signal peptidase I
MRRRDPHGRQEGQLPPVWLLASIAAAVALTGAIGYARRRLLVVSVDGQSMEPTLYEGDRLLVRRRGLRHLRRGDLVILRPPRHPREVGSGHWREAGGGTHVKRVAALPGHPMPSGVAHPSPVVPAESVVVLSDNAARGVDSRHWGPYPADGLVGVVVRRMTTTATGRRRTG